MGYLVMLGVLVGAALLAGCAPQGLPAAPGLPGVWTLTHGLSTATYTFGADGSVTFVGGTAGGPSAHIDGTWYIDNDKLGLAFTGLPTVEVDYMLTDKTLTIVDDPATVRQGTHANVVYTRVGQ